MTDARHTEKALCIAFAQTENLAGAFRHHLDFYISLTALATAEVLGCTLCRHRGGGHTHLMKDVFDDLYLLLLHRVVLVEGVLHGHQGLTGRVQFTVLLTRDAQVVKRYLKGQQVPTSHGREVFIAQIGKQRPITALGKPVVDMVLKLINDALHDFQLHKTEITSHLGKEDGILHVFVQLEHQLVVGTHRRDRQIDTILHCFSLTHYLYGLTSPFAHLFVLSLSHKAHGMVMAKQPSRHFYTTQRYCFSHKPPKNTSQNTHKTLDTSLITHQNDTSCPPYNDYIHKHGTKFELFIKRYTRKTTIKEHPAVKRHGLHTTYQPISQKVCKP